MVMNMITKVGIAITITEKNKNNNGNNTANQVIIKTETIINEETLILTWK